MKLNLQTKALLLCTVISIGMSAGELDSLYYKVEGQVSFSNGRHTPFWLANNRQGLSSVKKNNGYFRAGLFRNIDENKRFSWGAGIDLAGAI